MLQIGNPVTKSQSSTSGFRIPQKTKPQRKEPKKQETPLLQSNVYLECTATILRDRMISRPSSTSTTLLKLCKTKWRWRRSDKIIEINKWSNLKKTKNITRVSRTENLWNKIWKYYMPKTQNNLRKKTKIKTRAATSKTSITFSNKEIWTRFWSMMPCRTKKNF